MIDFFIIIVLFGAVFSIVYFFVLDDKVQDVNIQKRLLNIREEQIQEQGASEANHIYNALGKRESLKKSNNFDLMKDQSEFRIPLLGVLFSKSEQTKRTKEMFKKADIKMPVDVFYMLIGSLILPFAILAIITVNVFLLIIGLIVGFMPIVYLQMKIKKRTQEFSQHFPDALGIIANSLRAGHSLLASLQMVAAESPYPVNKIFKTVSDEIALGREVRETLQDMTTTLPKNADLKFFITAVLIQKEIGGNLAEIIDTLCVTIREREKLMGLIKTQTAQAQLSGMVLGLAPVVIAGLVSLINPEYMGPLFNTPIGNAVLFISFLMSFLGFMVINKVTQIKV